jgi:hypothetical protein
MNINSSQRLFSVLIHLQTTLSRTPSRNTHSTIMSNQASWIPAATKQVSVGPADTYTPGPNELLVKIKSIAFTPIEAKIQK